MEYSVIEDGLTSGYRLLLCITLLLSVGTLAAFVVLHRATRQKRCEAVTGDEN